MAQNYTAAKNVVRVWSRSLDLLGPLEEAVMQGLWTETSGTAKELTQRINNAKTIPISPKTVLTCLTRLEAKGLVFHAQERRSYRFFSTMSERDLVMRLVSDRVTEILDRYGELP